MALLEAQRRACPKVVDARLQEKGLSTWQAEPCQPAPLPPALLVVAAAALLLPALLPRPRP